MVPDQQLIKETGATFTPPDLADFISDRILQNYHTSNSENPIKILDPACGEGALLSSIASKVTAKITKFELIGYDSNPNFLSVASSNLKPWANNGNISLINGDFLEQITINQAQTTLFTSSSQSNHFINNSIDLIIANPPYVRTQILGAEYAQKISKKFNLKGRVDLYYPFLIGMTHALKEGGILGVITSNRYLSTKSGLSIRKFLKQNFEILEVTDLGDTKLFDAAVLPAIFIGRKKSDVKNFTSRFIKIYEDSSNVEENQDRRIENFYDILECKQDGTFTKGIKRYKKTSGKIKFPESKDHSWVLLSSAEEAWINEVTKNAAWSIKDKFKVRVGIKTTADKIFIRENWDLVDHRPEDKLLRELISQENIAPWKISTDKSFKVLYPHYSDNGKKKTISLDQYPNASEYFMSHYEKLSSRKYLIEAGREWFEIWVPQNPAFWDLPKLVFPDISSYPRFYFDESKRIVNGNCYWIVAKNPSEVDFLLLIQGVANSQLMSRYHDLMFNNKLYSGRRRYFSQYVEKYPLPDIDSPHSQEIISLVKILNSDSNESKQGLVHQLEISVAAAFGVEPILTSFKN